MTDGGAGGGVPGRYERLARARTETVGDIRMPLTREQHWKLAERYSNPDPDWSPDEVAKAAQLAKVHAFLGREPKR
jgi:hypothetical protein